MLAPTEKVLELTSWSVKDASVSTTTAGVSSGAAQKQELATTAEASQPISAPTTSLPSPFSQMDMTSVKDASAPAPALLGTEMDGAFESIEALSGAGLDMSVLSPMTMSSAPAPLATGKESIGASGAHTPSEEFPAQQPPMEQDQVYYRWLLF